MYVLKHFLIGLLLIYINPILGLLYAIWLIYFKKSSN